MIVLMTFFPPVDCFSSLGGERNDRDYLMYFFPATFFSPPLPLPSHFSLCRLGGKKKRHSCLIFDVFFFIIIIIIIIIFFFDIANFWMRNEIEEKKKNAVSCNFFFFDFYIL